MNFSSFMNRTPTVSTHQEEAKIVDCFIFYNELDLLEYRLTILYDIVDYFVICEGSRTHVGTSKPFFFFENKERYARFANKIVHIMMSDDDTQWIVNPDKEKQEQWDNENTHRNGIARGIQYLVNNERIGKNPFDIITICDLDEIPNPTILRMLKTANLSGITDGGISLLMDFYYYNLNCISQHKWSRAKIVFLYAFYNLFNTSSQKIRMYDFANTVEKGGWHLSYFGDEYFIKNKIENFAHQELNKEEFINVENIREKIKNAIDLYNRPYEKWHFISADENEFLPPITNHIIKFLTLPEKPTTTESHI